MQKNSVNYNFVNILKFFFSILVIAGHTKVLNYINNSTIKEILVFFGETAVPFFFISMGYSLAEKIDFNNPSNRDLMKMKVVLKGVIKQYLLWSIVYLPLALIEYFETGNSFIYSFFSYLKGLFLKGEHYNSWMLWYLLSFVYSFGFIYICSKRKISYKKIIIFSFLIGSLSILIKGIGIYDISFSSNIITYIIKFMKLTIDNGRIFTGFIYVPLGIILEKCNISSKVLSFAFILSFIYVFTSNYFISACCRILLGLSLFMISLNIPISKKYNTFCDRLRDLSTSNYYLHMWVFSIYYYIVYRKPTYTIDCFIYTALITVFMGILYLFYKTRKIQK